jgi:TRAP transporter TAXI family solute receptor
MDRENFLAKINEYKWWLIIGVSVMILSSIIYSMYTIPNSFTLATGDPKGNYHKLGLIFKEEMKKRGIEVNLLSSQGSVENLELLNRKKADIAFMQNNMTRNPEQNPDLTGIASLYHEPVFVFYQSDLKLSLLSQLKLSLLSQLKGKRISMGQKGSGTYFIARNLLEMNSLSEADIKPYYYSFSQMQKALIEKSIDVAFVITSVSSNSIKELVKQPGISLFNFENYKAYKYRSPKLGVISLPAGYYYLAENIPEHNTTLLTTLATLVSQKSVDPRLIETLLITIKGLSAREDNSSLSLENEKEVFPSEKFVDFPLHKAAEVYFRDGPSFLSRYFSYNFIFFLSKLKYFLIPLIPFLVIFMRIIPMLNRFRLNRVLKKKYKELNELETLITKTDSEESLREISIKLENLKILMDEASKKIPTQFQKDIYDWKLHLNLLTNALNSKIKQINKEKETFDLKK